MEIIPLIDHAAPIRGRLVSTPSVRTIPASRDQVVGRLLQPLPHRGRHDRAAPVGGHGHAPPAQRVARASPARRSHPSTRGRLKRVPAVVAVGHVEQAGRVADRAGQAAGGRRVVADLQLGPARDAPVGRLQPDEAREPGGDADRPAAVAAGGQRDETAGDGRRAPARRPARRARRVPRVARRAVEQRAGDVDAAELAGRRLAGQHGPAVVDQPRDEGRGVRRDLVGEHDAGVGGRPTGHVVELLDADGHAHRRASTRRPPRPRRGRPRWAGSRTRSARWRRWPRRWRPAPRAACAHHDGRPRRASRRRPARACPPCRRPYRGRGRRGGRPGRAGAGGG